MIADRLDYLEGQSVRTVIPKTTLAKWRKEGKGPVFVKRGGRIEYPSTEFRVWLQVWRNERAAVDLWGFG